MYFRKVAVFAATHAAAAAAAVVALLTPWGFASTTSGDLADSPLTMGQLMASQDRAAFPSLGQPLDWNQRMLLENTPLGKLETPVDSAPADEDIRGWTDEQIEGFYRDEWDLGNYWLDEMAVSSSAAYRIGESVIASSNGSGRGGLSAVACLGLAIQGEAGGEPMAGKIAVGKAVLARAKGHPERVCAVIFAGGQFESMDGRRRQPVNAESLRAAKESIGSRKSCDYDYFLNKSLQRALGRPMPQWMRDFDARGCASKVVGHQTFYSSCNCQRQRNSGGSRHFSSRRHRSRPRQRAARS